MLAPAISREKSAPFSSSNSKFDREERFRRTNPESVLAEVEERFARLAQAAVEAVDKVNRELSRSRFPINRIKCECDSKSLLLTGVTSQYYYVQIALEAALRHAGSMPVQLKVVVAQQA